MIKKLFAALLLAVGVAVADTTTTNLGLVKPAQSSPNWGTKVNNNYDIIDSSVAILSGNNVFTGSNTFTGVLNISSQSLSRLYLGTSTYSGSEILAVNGNAKFFGTNGAVVRLCDQNGINCQVLSTDNSNPETGVSVSTITVGRIGTNLNGRSDISFGNSALPAGPTGSLQRTNTAIGTGALNNYGWKPNNSQGGGNTAVGAGALGGLNYGSENTSMGDLSCAYITTGSYNICMGWAAGTGDGGGTETVIATSTILIGQYTGAASSNTHLTNAVAIGDFAKVNSSNSFVMGTKVGSGYSYDPFNVGIGTDTPRERLHIVGDFRVDDGSIYVTGLPANECMQTGSNGLVTTSGAPCGSGGGGGGSSSLEIMANNLRVSSPTATAKFNGTANGIGINASASGSTATLTFSMLPGNTQYWNYPSTGTFVAGYGITATTATASSITSTFLTVSSNTYLGTGTTIYANAGGISTPRIRWADGTISTTAFSGSGGSGSSPYLTKFVLVNSSNVPCEFTVNTAGAIVSSVAASIDPGIIARNSIVKQDPDFGTWTITANTTCTIVTSPGGSVYEAVSDLLLNDANNKTWVISVNTTGSMVTL